MSENIESPLRFPNPIDSKYWIVRKSRDSNPDRQEFNRTLFTEDYESCLVELGLIIENTFDPVLRKKLEDLMRGVTEWLT